MSIQIYPRRFMFTTSSPEDREEIEEVKEELRTERGKEKMDEKVEQSLANARLHLTEAVLDSNNRNAYEQIKE